MTLNPKREIKFRAWDTLRREWASRWLIELSDENATLNNRGNIEVDQYTGLHDKNGKEIYEGDIVKWNDTLWVIVWNKRFCQYILQTVNSFVKQTTVYAEWHFFRERMEGYSEIIGNIHENGELLNAKS
jgi:uncharacterized phage protein (TIGR01671 family)